MQINSKKSKEAKTNDLRQNSVDKGLRIKLDVQKINKFISFMNFQNEALLNYLGNLKRASGCLARTYIENLPLVFLSIRQLPLESFWGF